MWESGDIYLAGYYIKGHPEDCHVKVFQATNDKEALAQVDKMNSEDKFVFELSKQVLAFKTIKEWEEK